MKYQVYAPHTVAYMDFEGQTDDGLYREHKACQGIVEADDPAQAVILTHEYIHRQYPGCWSLTVHLVDVTSVAESEAAPC